MSLDAYLGIVRRRWILIAVIIVLDAAASLYLYRKATHALGSQSCTTIYVADVSSPSLIAASTTDATAQLLAGESAANFFADDLLDVAQSKSVASFLSNRLEGAGLANAGTGDISVSGARQDRTVNLCVSDANAQTAQRAAAVLGQALTSQRARFVGGKMAARTFVRVISPPESSAVSTSHDRLNLGLRLVLGLLVAVGAALLWDVLDPRVRDAHDVEAALGAPVLTGG